MRKEADYVLELGWGYWKSQAIFAGVELGVFELLGEFTLGKEDIARRLGTNPRATGMLLDALVALRLLEKKAGLYKNSPISSKYLVRGSPVYQGDRIHHLHNLWQRWARLQDALRTGQNVLEEEGELEPGRLKDFMLSMHNNACLKARVILKRFRLSHFSRLLDLGGAPGTYSIEFARANPGLSCVVFDLEPNIEITKGFIKEAGLEYRVTTQVGNCLEDIPGVYDMVFVSNLLHIYDSPTNIEILKKCHRALEPGGKVVIHDFLLNEAGTGPTFPALFSLNMLLGTCSGASFNGREVKGWLIEAGFESIKTMHLNRDSALIIGKKPA